MPLRSPVVVSVVVVVVFIAILFVEVAMVTSLVGRNISVFFQIKVGKGRFNVPRVYA